MRENRLLTPAEATAIHAVLAALARAPDSEDALRDFVRHATRDGQVEYRFQGCLGFGGKFYWDGRSARVGFYREHHTLLRQAVADCAGARIAAILGLPLPAESDPHALLAECAAAMGATSQALAHAERVRLAAGSGDPVERPPRGAAREAASGVRDTRDALDAALLRAREALARRAGYPPPGEA